MDGDVTKTGTYVMRLADDGMTRLEARARHLAAEAKDRDWMAYVETAKVQLLTEAGYPPSHQQQEMK